MKAITLRSLLFALGIIPFSQGVGDWDISGSVGVETRTFPDSPRYTEQFSGTDTSVIARPEIRYRDATGRLLFRFEAYARHGRYDSGRDNADVGEMAVTYLFDDWEVSAGVDKVFWGVTESRHLVDIINQTDAAESIDGEEKLGQQLLAVTHQADWGRVSLLALPGFRERTFPGVEGRLRPPLPVDTDRPLYESSAGDRHTDYAVRYSHYFGDWDLGVYAFDGTSREPLLVPDASDKSLTPYYQQITQAGADIQYTRDAWLFKLETIRRRGHGEEFSAAVAGIEYTLYQVGGGAADIGLLTEFLYDGRDENAPTTPFARDLFVGTRWALNDAQDTSLLAGVIVDLDDRSTLLSIEAQRRLGQSWTVELETRWFMNIAPENVLDGLRQDSHITLRATRYF